MPVPRKMFRPGLSFSSTVSGGTIFFCQAALSVVAMRCLRCLVLVGRSGKRIVENLLKPLLTQKAVIVDHSLLSPVVSAGSNDR